MIDLASWKKDPAIDLEYDGVRDLKPPPAVYREYLERLVEKAAPNKRRRVDVAAAFATDVAVDGSGNTRNAAKAASPFFLKAAARRASWSHAVHLH